MADPAPRVILFSIGSELLAGETVDTNAAFIAGQLGALGLVAVGVRQLPDDQAVISAAFLNVLGRVRPDQTPFKTKYEPGNPAADAKGEVKLPNVNTLVETMDMREAQRSYEANLNIITTTRRMIARTLEILR